MHAGSRFNSTPFEGTLTFARNTTVRGGPRDLNWDLGLGAIWLYALQSTMSGPIEITDSSFLDSTYNAMLFVVDWPVKDDYAITNVAVRNIKVDGTGTNVVNARVGGWATFENVDARNVGAPFVNNCGTFHFDGRRSSTYGCWPATTAAGPDATWCEDRPPSYRRRRRHLGTDGRSPAIRVRASRQARARVPRNPPTLFRSRPRAGSCSQATSSRPLYWRVA